MKNDSITDTKKLVISTNGGELRPYGTTKQWINKRTGEIESLPLGIDPGWDYNVGKNRSGWDKYGHLPDCTGAGLNAFRKGACAKISVTPKQKKWSDIVGLVSVAEIADKYKLKSPLILPKSDSYEKALRQTKDILLPKGVKDIVIETPMHSVIINERHIAHLVEKRIDARERYANFILPTLKNPYEIWATRYTDESIRPNYIGVFKGKKDLVVIIKEAKDGMLIWNIFQKSNTNINLFRIGILIHQKEDSGVL